MKLHTAVVANNLDAQRFLQLAAAPAPQWFPHTVETRHPSQMPSLKTEALSLIIWQAGTGADDVLKKLETFTSEGGAVLCLPPANTPGESAMGPFGLTWQDVENAPPAALFRVATWDDRDGPLARSRDGISLPVGKLTFARRQLPSPVSLATSRAGMDSTVEPWIPLATYEGGQPFLLKKRVGRGSIFVCTSLPQPEWSTLGEGLVLVPMVQRILKEGGTRLSTKGNEECGVWLPADESEPWTALNHTGNYRWNAGIYVLGSQHVALNRPAIEDDPAKTPVDRARALFGPVDVQVFEETVESAKKDTTTELWPLMLLLAMLCMMMESSLLIADRMAKRKHV